MTPTVRYAGERNGYSIKVYEFTVKGAKRFGSRVTNLTTGSSEESPYWSMYRTALEMAQQTADEAKL